MGNLLARLFRKKQPAPPVIETQWGPVSETARQQAMTNLYNDPEHRRLVEDTYGIDKCRANYPELYEQLDAEAEIQ